MINLDTGSRKLNTPDRFQYGRLTCNYAIITHYFRWLKMNKKAKVLGMTCFPDYMFFCNFYIKHVIIFFLISEDLYRDQIKIKENTVSKTTCHQSYFYFAACLLCRTIIMYKSLLLYIHTRVNTPVHVYVTECSKSLLRETLVSKETYKTSEE